VAITAAIISLSLFHGEIIYYLYDLVVDLLSNKNDLEED
jgi:hypothetical protein